MATFRRGSWSRRVRTASLIVFLFVLLATFGGCAWIQNWFNPNHSPVAVISANPISGEAPLEVTFDALQSYDPDGDEISYEWDFGDGEVAQRETIQHGFGTAGSYTVKLQITDSKGKSNTSTKVISVSQPYDEITKEQTFDAQAGIEYASGTGLKISVPPDASGGQKRLVVTENPTPQQPEGDSIEIHSAYDVAIISEGGSQAQGITPKSGSNSNVRLTFEIPPNVDPNDAMILEWTDHGWVLARTDNCLGGILSSGRRYIYVDLPHLSKYALASSKKKFEVGDLVTVINAPRGRNIREWDSATNVPSESVKTVPEGWVLEIIDAPNQPRWGSLNGKVYLWWKVREKGLEPQPVEGWIAQRSEYNGDSEWLTKVDYKGSPPTSPESLTKTEWEAAAEKAIQWAIDPARNNSDEHWGGLCAKFVASAFGQESAGYDADDLAELYLKKKGLFYPNPDNGIYGNPPRGALIFFEPCEANENYGHVAIHLGAGEMVNAYKEDVRTMDVMAYLIPPNPIRYKGWAYPPWQCLFRSQPTSPGFPGEGDSLEEIHTLTSTMRWEEVPCADGYGVYISEYPYGERYLVYANNDIPGSRTSLELPSGILEWDKNYRWNMRAHFPKDPCNSKEWGYRPERLYFHTSPADSTSPSNEPPSVTIVSPQDGSAFTEGETITFQGEAVDPEDGRLSGSSLVWISSIDGQLSTGESLTTNTLSVGTYTITLTATDSDGDSSSASINITVSSAGPTPQPGPSEGKIAFASDRDCQWAEIYVMNADGSNVQRLTYTLSDGGRPAWSPDGTRIAFLSGGEIYVMNADGSNQHNIANNPAWDEDPAWSPDGRKIAFTSHRDRNNDIYVMNADGSNVQRLTNDPADDCLPAWSPDGTKIAFASGRYGNAYLHIYVMNTDGSNQHNITNDYSPDWEPAWSPDGTRIAFSSRGEIYVMNADGSNQHNITNDYSSAWWPAWSPDGTKIAFASNRVGPWEIYVMNADGSNVQRLTDGWGPAWSPALPTASNVTLEIGGDK